MPLTGPGGLLGRLAKVVAESALEAGLDGHLGYRRHEGAGDGSGNSRNGHAILRTQLPYDPKLSRAAA